MFDMDSLIQPHIDRIRPLAQSAAAEMRSFGHRVITRLDRIGDLLEQDNAAYFRERPQFNLAAGGSEQFIVPAGETWLIESVTMVPSGVVGTPGGVTLGVGGGLPLWGGNHAGRPATQGGNGVRLESGMQVTAMALEVGCLVMVQVRIERKVPTARGRFNPQERPTHGDDATPNIEPWRHTGTWRAG